MPPGSLWQTFESLPTLWRKSLKYCQQCQLPKKHFKILVATTKNLIYFYNTFSPLTWLLTWYIIWINPISWHKTSALIVHDQIRPFEYVKISKAEKIWKRTCITGLIRKNNFRNGVKQLKHDWKVWLWGNLLFMELSDDCSRLSWHTTCKRRKISFCRVVWS